MRVGLAFVIVGIFATFAALALLPFMEAANLRAQIYLWCLFGVGIVCVLWGITSLFQPKYETAKERLIVRTQAANRGTDQAKISELTIMRFTPLLGCLVDERNCLILSDRCDPSNAQDLSSLKIELEWEPAFREGQVTRDMTGPEKARVELLGPITSTKRIMQSNRRTSICTWDIAIVRTTKGAEIHIKSARLHDYPMAQQSFFDAGFDDNPWPEIEQAFQWIDQLPNFVKDFGSELKVIGGVKGKP